MRASRLLLMTLLLFTGLAGAAVAQVQGEAPAMNVPSTRAVIETILREEETAWNKGDAAAFAAHVLPDVVFTNVVGRFSVGKEPFVAQHARIFSTIYKGSTLKQTLVQLSLVRPDVAIADTLAEVTGFQELPPGLEAAGGVLRTRLEQVFVRNDGEWWVASFHNVAINPSIPQDAPAPH